MGTRCTALLNKSCTAPHSLSLLIATACLAILVRSSSGGLYDASDRVDILDHSNFNASVYNTSRDFVYFIEFYNAWCGHCIHFAPTWKALGNSIVPWRQHVRLAAVDCNDQINLALCRQHEIRRVPALLFFMPHPSADSKGELCDCRQDEASLKRSILTYLSGLPFPRAIAPLKSIPKSPPSGTVLAVVVESAASSVGQNLVLALNGKNAHTTTAVRRFIADDVDQLAKFGVSTLPSLVVISKVGPPKVYKSRAVGEDSTATEFVRRILRIDPTLRTVHPVEAGISPRLKDIEPPTTDSSLSTTSSASGTPLLPHVDDINSGVIYSFQHEIMSRTTLVGKTKTALTNYLRSLLLFAPLRPELWHAVNAAFDELSATGDALVNTGYLMHLMDKSGVSVDNSDVRWRACQPSNPGRRGYPCALWLTFHAMTVAALRSDVEANRRETVSDELQYQRNAVAPDGVLSSIRGYIDVFFQCSHCRRHFLSVYDNSTATAKRFLSNLDAVLWLHDAHNRANVRLAADDSVDPAFPKQVFPTDSICPKCYSTSKSGSGEHLLFDMDMVIEFMRAYYAYPDADIPAALFFVRRKSDLTWGTSLAMFLIILSAFSIVALFYNRLRIARLEPLQQLILSRSRDKLV